MPGRVNNVSQILPACSFAVHPSKGKVGYSLSILEYRLARLPVIVPDTPSVCGATINMQTGVIYKEGFVYYCCKAITALLSARLNLRAIGHKAKTYQRENFNLDNYHQQLSNVFKHYL